MRNRDQVQSKTAHKKAMKPRHHRALNVPAGPALAPGRIPHWLTLLGLLPQREISGRLLPTQAHADGPLTFLDELHIESGLRGELGIVVLLLAVKFLGVKVH